MNTARPSALWRKLQTSENLPLLQRQQGSQRSELVQGYESTRVSANSRVSLNNLQQRTDATQNRTLLQDKI